MSVQPRSPHDALAWAHNECGDPGWSGMCLSFVRTGYNLPGVYASAADAWKYAKKRHTMTSASQLKDVPLGAPIFMQGSNPNGHVAFVNGDGKNICTTHSGYGYPVVQPLTTWLNQYGYKLQGWTEDLNGYTVCSPSGGNAPDTPGIDMPFDSSRTTKAQTLAGGGAWTTLKVDDAGNSSILATPTTFLLVAHVNVKGLPAGAVGKLRIVYVDTEDGGKNGVVASTGPVVEFIGTSGSTAAAFTELGKMGKATTKGKTSRRLRLQAAFDTPEKPTTSLVDCRWVY